MPRIPVVSPQSVGLAPGGSRKGPATPLEFTKSRAGRAVQQNAAAAAQVATSSPFADGTYLQGCKFTGGVPLTLQHGLVDAQGNPRQYVDAWVMIGTATANFQVMPQSDARLASRQITITADANTTAGVWVF